MLLDIDCGVLEILQEPASSSKSHRLKAARCRPFSRTMLAMLTMRFSQDAAQLFSFLRLQVSASALQMPARHANLPMG